MSCTITIEPHPPVYPYLITRIIPAVYQLEVLPNIDEVKLVRIALKKEGERKLRTCLVLGEKRAVYVFEGKIDSSNLLPAGGTLITNSMRNFFRFTDFVAKDPTFAAREKIVADHIKTQKDGYAVSIS